MSLSCLATEVVLQILQYVEPRDLISLRTCSTGFLQVIEQHERPLCRAIALSRGLGKAPRIPSKVLPALNTLPLQELRILMQLWDRHQLIEQLVPVILLSDQDEMRCPQMARRGLGLLWDYHNALRIESRDPEVESYRSFVRSVTLQELNSLIMTIEACGEALLDAFESKRPRSLRERSAAFTPFVGAYSNRNLVIIEGLDFLVKAVVERSPEALDEVQNWKNCTAKPPMSRLCAEIRWKKQLAMMGLSDTGSGE
ncbi:hypothetical protein MMC30_009245 [Trapelia coarctata]|nr:hypothetical protein [Trapelia coarctata]